MERQEALEKTIAKIYTEAKRRGACPLFTGEEKSVREIVELLTKPQGIEFCMNSGFPSIELFREFASYGSEEYGMWVDAGDITITNPELPVVIVGKTTAVINVNELRRFQIYLFYGAKVVVEASGWAVVYCEKDRSCRVVRHCADNAIFL